MATFTVERAYMVPVYQHVTVEADSAEAAMRRVAEGADAETESWDSSTVDYENSGAVFVDGCWEGDDAYAGDSLAIPADLERPAEERARRLAAGLSDMIQGKRLTEADIPDDWQWLAEQLAAFGQ